MGLMAGRWTRLYREMTEEELSMEVELAKRGWPYRVQHPLWLWYGKKCSYFPDFYVMRPGAEGGPFVLEVDDPSHRRKVKEDRVRTAAILRITGCPVYRTTNESVRNDVARALRVALGEE